MIKRIAAFVSVALGLNLAFTNCGDFASLTSGQSANLSLGRFNSSSNGVELIRSPDTGAGIRMKQACLDPDVNPSCAGISTYILRNPNHPELAGNEPVWTGSQWGSTSSVPAAAVRSEDGYVFGNPEKAITLYPDGRVRLAVNGLSDLGGQYQTFSLNRKWPHLLLEQTISAPSGVPSSGSIKSMSSLVLNIDAHLIHQEANVRPGYNVFNHSNAATLYFTVQNLNQTHPDFGKYIWIGIPIYDTRESLAPGWVQHDDGTRMLIVMLSASMFTNVGLDSGQWINFSADILPNIRNAVEQARTRNYISDGDLANYFVGGMNIGFENLGLNTTTLEYKNLSLRAQTSGANVPPVVPIPGSTPPPATTTPPSSTPIATPRPASAIQKYVHVLYKMTLGRTLEIAPDDFWVQLYQTNQSCVHLTSAFVQSAEPMARENAMNNAQVVSYYYQSILGRNDTSAFWENRIATTSRAQVRTEFLTGAELQSRCRNAGLNP